MTSRGGFWDVSSMFSDIKSVRCPLIGSKVVVTSGGVRQAVSISRIIANKMPYAFITPEFPCLTISLCTVALRFRLTTEVLKNLGPARETAETVLFQPFNANISKLHWIIVAGKAERT